MNSFYLSDDEIRGFTKRKKYTAQIRWLRAQGIEVLIRPDGSPAVHRQAVAARMGVAANDPDPPRIEPNWDALDAPKAQARK